MKISNNKVVTIDYTLTDDDGNLLDTSEGQSALSYLHGAGNIIPGLEGALAGKIAGEELAVAVAAQDGYGLRDDSRLQTIPRDMFPTTETIQPGMRFHAQSPEGGMLVVTVVGVDNDNITIDANHPLAGMNLNFNVKVVDVRNATAEELEHGHVHGPDDHHHG